MTIIRNFLKSNIENTLRFSDIVQQPIVVELLDAYLQFLGYSDDVEWMSMKEIRNELQCVYDDLDNLYDDLTDGISHKSNKDTADIVADNKKCIQQILDSTSKF